MNQSKRWKNSDFRHDFCGHNVEMHGDPALQNIHAEAILRSRAVTVQTEHKQTVLRMRFAAYWKWILCNIEQMLSNLRMKKMIFAENQWESTESPKFPPKNIRKSKSRAKLTFFSLLFN